MYNKRAAYILFTATQHHSHDEPAIAVEHDKVVCDEQDIEIEDGSCFIQDLSAFMS